MTVTEIRPADVDPPGEPTDPDLIEDRYRLLEVVGAGRDATVWRAVDERLQRVVAIKVFRASMPAHAADLGARLGAIARLSHPNVTTMYDSGHLGGPAGVRYLVLEFLDGISLDGVLTLGPLPPVAAAEVGLAVADALAHVHERGAGHGDVRSSNVVVPRAGGAFVWAAAKLAEPRLVGIADQDGAGTGEFSDSADLPALADLLSVLLAGPELDELRTDLLAALRRPNPAARPPVPAIAHAIARHLSSPDTGTPR